jgi:23S rRNA (cytosine1962-C5)-methyltransferase
MRTFAPMKHRNPDRVRPKPQLQVESLTASRAYSLLDAGNGEKLERFGEYVLIRPEPQALWTPNRPPEDWHRQAHARFEQTGSHSGEWKRIRPLPDRWEVGFRVPSGELRMRLALTGFKHVGVFPEQALNWLFIQEQVRRVRGGRVLNLFAYTGGATLAAALSGAQVTHVDSIKQVINWASDNADLNNLRDIRWMKEDALKFVQREVRRGSRYEGILMDPPAFGHGPNGERWRLEDQLNELIAGAARLLSPGGFFLINAYSLGLSALVVQSVVQAHFPKQFAMEAGELVLPLEYGPQVLPTGCFVRFGGN